MLQSSKAKLNTMLIHFLGGGGGGKGGQGHTMCIVGDVLNVSAQFQSRAVPPVLSRDPP